MLYVLVVMEVGSRRILHSKCDGASDGGMDGAAVPRSHSERACLPASHSRSRLDFLGASGQGLKEIWLEDSANADTSAKGKRFLRTLGGDDASGVLGLGDSPERKASARNSEGVDNALQ